MASRIDWQIQAPEGVPEPTAPAPPAAPGERPRPGWRFWGGYLGILALAALFGFGLGRFSEIEARRWEGVESSLRLEQLARQRGDAELYASTLDPDAPEHWRAERMADFAPHPEAALARPIRIEALARDRLLVELEPAPEEPPERRLYRLVGERWLRAPQGQP